MAAKISKERLEQDYQKYMPYLLEIRKRLFFLSAIFITFSALGFMYYEIVITSILRLFRLAGVNIVFTSPFQYINLAINSAFLVGLMVIFPLLIFQIISFLKPALTKNEHRTIIILVPMSIVLFVGGFSFGVVMMRYILTLFYEKSVQLDIGNFLDVSNFLSQMLTTSLLMGLAFQFPIVLTVLLKFDVITYGALVKQRIIAYTSSLVFAALLPPTDLISLALLTMPLILMFETTLLLNKIVFKSHKKVTKRGGDT